MVVFGNVIIFRDRFFSLLVFRFILFSLSVILERRDVKLDEDMSGKNIVMYRNEGFYFEFYFYYEGRMSIVFFYGGYSLDVFDYIIVYYRIVIRLASAYCNFIL